MKNKKLTKEDILEAIDALSDYVSNSDEEFTSYYMMTLTNTGRQYTMTSCNEGFEDLTLSRLNESVELIRQLAETTDCTTTK